MLRAVPKASAAPLRCGRKATLSIAAVCWFLLWTGINTGPGNIDLDYIEKGWTGAFNGIRAAFPLLILLISVLYCFFVRRARRHELTTPEKLWLWYGLICTLSSLYAEPWFTYAYWGLAYLGALGAAHIYVRETRSTIGARQLNYLTWVLCAAALVTVVYVARGKLLTETSIGLSGYGINGRIRTVAGMPMVRSTGIARMAAVPAIVAFVALWNRTDYLRPVWAAVFISCSYLIWIMQARGSTASLAFALALVMVLLDGRARIVGWSLLALVTLVFIAGFIPDDTIHWLYLYATRQGHELGTMSGRTFIYHAAWRKILEAPIIGYGPQADRQFPIQIGNAQNGVLYALLCGGFVGAAGYIGGLAVSWFMLIGVLAQRDRLRVDERVILLQVTGIMAFFTLRSYPENCAALYSVDLLVQLPAIVYIGELHRTLRRLDIVRRAADETSWKRRNSAHVALG